MGATAAVLLLTAPFFPGLAVLSPFAVVAMVAWAMHGALRLPGLLAGWTLGTAGTVVLAWVVHGSPTVVLATALWGIGLWIASRSPIMTSGRIWLIVGLLAVAAAATTAYLLVPVGNDVHNLHLAATEAIDASRNPWTTLSVADTSPTATDATIDGYPYPVLTLGVTTLGTLVSGDPRMAMVAVWLLGCLALVARSVLSREQSTASRTGSVTGSLRPLVLLVALPTTVGVIEVSWTEPLTFGLLATGLATWSSWPVSAVLVGLGLASKQYMIVLTPLILGMRTSWRRRSTILAVAMFAVLPGFLLGRGYLHAIVGSHASRAARADATNLPGLFNLGQVLDAGILNAVAILGSLAVGGWLAGGVRSADHFARCAAATLAVFFLLSAQAFANYWWLVGTLGLTALVLRPASGQQARSAGGGSCGSRPNPGWKST